MGLVKAKMAFYHDKVGTRANGEMFEVKNEQTCSMLEQAGYVEKVADHEAKAHQEHQERVQKSGKQNARDNEAVSMANHLHNQASHEHLSSVKQARQMRQEQAQQQEQQATPKSAKKADKE